MPHVGHALAIFAAILWGLTYCLDERVLEGLSVAKLYFLHCATGVVVAGLLLLAGGEPPGALFRFDSGKTSPGLLALTLATATGAALAILWSIRLLGAGPSAVLEISYPLFVALFSVLFFGGRVPWPVLAGGAFIFIGAAIIVTAK